MQRFKRDINPSGSTSEHLVRGFDERVAIIERHFPPSVAQVYAIPKPGRDGAIEWWTTQQGQVTPFAQLSEQEQSALLQRHAQHLTQLGSLAHTLESRGMQPQAELLRGLLTPAEPATMYSVEGRLLMTWWPNKTPVAAEPASSPPTNPMRRWVWLGLIALLALVLLLALLWWWFMIRARVPVVPVAKPVAMEVAKPEPEPEPTPEPPQQWPTQVAFVLDTSAAMTRRTGLSSTPRKELAKREIERIIGVLPPATETRLVRYAGKKCVADAGHGAFEASRRGELLALVRQARNEGNAPLGASLRAAAAEMDGKERDGLIFVFAGGDDSCGEDVCATAKEIHREKPRLRINLVDLTGLEKLDVCMALSTGGSAYSWGEQKSEGGGVDLSKEAERMLKP